MTDDRQKLNHLQEKDKAVVTEALSAAEDALRYYEPVLTPFYSPAQWQLAKKRLEGFDDLMVRAHGGYREAERRRMELRPVNYLPPLEESPVSLLELRGGFSTEALDQGLLLDVLEEQGIARNMIGDIILNDLSVQLVMASELAPTLKKRLTQLMGSPVSIHEIEEVRLEKGESKSREIRATVPSLRLDSVASSGFGSSRSKMKDEILGERVKVNWEIEKDPARNISLEDVISMEGRGRVKIKEVIGTSRRGRVKVLLKRYY